MPPTKHSRKRSRSLLSDNVKHSSKKRHISDPATGLFFTKDLDLHSDITKLSEEELRTELSLLRNGFFGFTEQISNGTLGFILSVPDDSETWRIIKTNQIVQALFSDDSFESFLQKKPQKKSQDKLFSQEWKDKEGESISLEKEQHSSENQTEYCSKNSPNQFNNIFPNENYEPINNKINLSSEEQLKILNSEIDNQHTLEATIQNINSNSDNILDEQYKIVLQENKEINLNQEFINKKNSPTNISSINNIISNSNLNIKEDTINIENNKYSKLKNEKRIHKNEGDSSLIEDSSDTSGISNEDSEDQVEDNQRDISNLVNLDGKISNNKNIQKNDKNEIIYKENNNEDDQEASNSSIENDGDRSDSNEHSEDNTSRDDQSSRSELISQSSTPNISNHRNDFPYTWKDIVSASDYTILKSYWLVSQERRMESFFKNLTLKKNPRALTNTEFIRTTIQWMTAYDSNDYPLFAIAFLLVTEEFRKSPTYSILNDSE